jgi:hypothetical protein
MAAPRSITCGAFAVTKDIVSDLIPDAGWLILKFLYLDYPAHSARLTERAIGATRLKFRLQTGGEGNQVVTYGSRFCDRVLERNVGNLRAAKHH